MSRLAEDILTGQQNKGNLVRKERDAIDARNADDSKLLEQAVSAEEYETSAKQRQSHASLSHGYADTGLGFPHTLDPPSTNPGKHYAVLKTDYDDDYSSVMPHTA